MPELSDQPVVIQCAVTGSSDADPERRPNVPLTTEAIAAEAVAAWRAGAAVVHLHAREEDGTPTQDPAAYARLVDAIRERGCEAILNLSCGTAGSRVSGDARFALLELEPEMASFDSGSVNFGERIFEGDLPFLRRMAEAFARHGVVPEIECFDSGHVGIALQLRDEGLLRDPLRVQLVLGVPGTGVPASFAQADHMLRMLPEGVPWSICAIGRRQLAMNTYCLIAGGHVRTGLEDNLWYARGERATNAMLVERVVRLAAEVGRPVATSQQARELLALGGA
ncbi:MAG: 3-keto-5-aminohexanoate cleavage enzyme [Solirubrobacteraceae bacterium]|jgi:3-keto-5-aminohexanoate cleavage enzyme|nr:3-keto-5-aminohexanoate cleavage enzyme [Solirubrobacteraceae bacterium]